MTTFTSDMSTLDVLERLLSFCKKHQLANVRVLGACEGAHLYGTNGLAYLSVDMRQGGCLMHTADIASYEARAPDRIAQLHADCIHLEALMAELGATFPEDVPF